MYALRSGSGPGHTLPRSRRDPRANQSCFLVPFFIGRKARSKKTQTARWECLVFVTRIRALLSEGSNCDAVVNRSGHRIRADSQCSLV